MMNAGNGNGVESSSAKIEEGSNGNGNSNGDANHHEHDEEKLKINLGRDKEELEAADEVVKVAAKLRPATEENYATYWALQNARLEDLWNDHGCSFQDWMDQVRKIPYIRIEYSYIAESLKASGSEEEILHQPDERTEPRPLKLLTTKARLAAVVVQEKIQKLQSILDTYEAFKDGQCDIEDMVALITTEAAERDFLLQNPMGIQFSAKKDIELAKGKVKEAVKDLLTAISYKTLKVRGQLAELSGLSQAESTVEGSRNTSAAISFMKREIGKRQKLGILLPVIDMDEIFTSPGDLEGVLDLLPDKPPDEVDVERLCDTFEVIDKYAQNASFLLPHNGGTAIETETKEAHRKKYKMRVEAGIQELEEKVSTKLKRESTGSCENGGTTKDLPGAHNFELEGAQPWVQFIFSSVAKCLNSPFKEVSPKTSSPAKCRTHPNGIVPAMAWRRKRVVDITLMRYGRHRIVFFDDDMELTCEVKPGCRESSDPQDLLTEARDQVLSHLAKSVAVGFNFGNGVGVPTHATGIVANAVSVQVIQLRLEHVGTPEVFLQLCTSKRLPLVSESFYDKWAASAGAFEDQFKALREELYCQENNEQWKKGANGRMLPPGLYMLGCLMVQQRQDLFGPRVTTTGDILGPLLGTGATANVFHRKDQPHAVKVSRYGLDDCITAEIKILSFLSKPNQCNYLPQLVDGHPLDRPFPVRVLYDTVEMTLPAVITCPVGVGAVQAVCRSENKEQLLNLILLHLTRALDFIHKKDVFHLDVSPKNVIVVYEDDGPSKAVLIDFSCAHHSKSQIKGFVGTPDYAHRSVFRRYPRKEWHAKSVVDTVGLAFTTVALANDGVVPWRPLAGLPKNHSSKQDFDESQGPLFKARLDSAIKFVDESVVFEEVIKRELKEWLNQDDSPYPV